MMRLVSIFGAVFLLASCTTEPSAPAGQPVSVTETADQFAMDNGVLSVVVSKKSGDLVSMKVNGVETLGNDSGHPYLYWSHDVTGAPKVEYRVTIDPKSNGGERAEVSVKAISNGKLMGHGPGTPPEGDLPIDIDIRYSLARGDSGVYTYTAFDHKPDYDAGDFAEARIAAKLDKMFTHIHVDAERSGKYPLLNEGVDKYVYVTRQWRERAYGWTAPARTIGWFMLVPSPEYLSGGPIKAEFLAHGTSPTVLSYWKSSHNGGASVTMQKGESYQRVVGPYLIYANTGANSDAMWADAKARLKKEEKAWPYNWVDVAGFAKPAERGTAKGKLVLDDGGARFSGDIYVGLTKTPYTLNEAAGPREIQWQNDGKTPQFWTQVTDRSGVFSIPNVPAGTYTLNAWGGGVLGDFLQANVTVKAGGVVDLGAITWKPQRYGRTAWEIGKPDKDAREFAGADKFFVPGQPLRYVQMFPDDIDYTVGKSSAAKDWHFSHMPHNIDPAAKIVDFSGVSGKGRDAPRLIRFKLDKQPTGKAVLRIATTSSGSRPVLDFSVNGVKQSRLSFGRDDAGMKRHQINGIWRLVDAPFDASLLKPGDNTLTITAPEGNLNDGVVYDYLRLEVVD